jgi:spermidine synthase
VWTRYLGLYVGHTAYAQLLVLTVYLGGMSVGALLVADRAKRVRDPLAWYVGTEVALGALGVLFPAVFALVTSISYDVLFPALGSGPLVGAARWGIATALILPQAILLGATFPFMATALARATPTRSGHAVAVAYLCNTLGGAVGVLLAGFLLVGWLGLGGTVIVAAFLNIAAAALAHRASSGSAPGLRPKNPDQAPVAPSPTTGPTEPAAVIFVVAFGTAAASFVYEIGWIRMLSLVLGSATHSFELMLSAFILGLAIGAWWVRGRVDEASDPLALVGVVQIIMGIGAALSLPLYLATYRMMPVLVTELPYWPAGYELFNLSRYALCLLVMLPATVAAGMTLPLLTAALIRSGWGERSIGGVYGINTVGSIAGAALAAMILLPIVGLKWLLLSGAALDVALGGWLLHRANARGRGSPVRDIGLGVVAASVLALVGLGVTLDRHLLTSAVFRYGDIPSADSREILYYEDGRTATVSAHVITDGGLVVLSTNGKPDASLGVRWFSEHRDSIPPTPLSSEGDYTTQLLAPLVGAAFAPEAKAVAIIGHGSGMSGQAFLTRPDLDRLVTIEIEPAMVEGSMLFLPVNEAVFTDPRSRFVFDDAKSYLAYSQDQFDILFAEPSNPWVSGVAGLFSMEFYARMRNVVADDGVLVQWVHLYELDDNLFLSVLAALDRSFPYYRAYLVGPADVVIVASSEAPLRSADWSVLGERGVLEMTHGIPRFEGVHLEAAFLFDEMTFRPLLDGVRPNSDFRPTLDSGAERARFLGSRAEGVLSFTDDRIDLVSTWTEALRSPLEYALVPTRDLQPMMDFGHGAWMRSAVEDGGAIAPLQYPEWTSNLVQLANFYSTLSNPKNRTTREWITWTRTFQSVEGYLHWGTSGWTHQAFYDAIFAMLAERNVPAEARAAVSLMFAVNTFDWPSAAAAADELVAPVAAGEEWLSPSLLLDAAVLAYSKTGRLADGHDALKLLSPGAGQVEKNARLRLLETLLRPAPHAWGH